MKHEDYMRLAIQLAKSALGQTSPNPVVGSVVVKDGKVVGFGAHLKAGEAHAEVHALQMAGSKAKGGTIYVTLEPCNHYGKTPPCTELIIEKGIQKVVIASVDPNPKVSGKGIERLKQAGIEVEVGLLKEEADELNKFFFHFMKTNRPYVTLKTATTLDGKIATSTGESKWISCEESREDVHHYRHEHDAILVGVGTILADNPSLTTRRKEGGKNPIRIVLDSRLRTPHDATIINDQAAETWIFTTKEADRKKIDIFQNKGIRIFQLDTITIREVLMILGKEQIMSVFVEGGATVNDSFLRERAVNQVITYIAPKLIGGKNALTSIGGIGIEKINDAVNLEIVSIEKIGTDVKIISVVKEGR